METGAQVALNLYCSPWPAGCSSRTCFLQIARNCKQPEPAGFRTCWFQSLQNAESCKMAETADCHLWFEWWEQSNANCPSWSLWLLAKPIACAVQIMLLPSNNGHALYLRLTWIISWLEVNFGLAWLFLTNSVRFGRYITVLLPNFSWR